MTKRYSAKKFQIVTELLSGDKSIGQVAKVYGVLFNDNYNYPLMTTRNAH